MSLAEDAFGILLQCLILSRLLIFAFVFVFIIGFAFVFAFVFVLFFFICIYCLYFYLYFYLYLYLKLFMINLRFGVLSLALLSSRQWWSGSSTSSIVCFTQPCRSPYHLVSSAEPQSSHQTTVLNNLENANTLYLYLYVFLSLFLHLYLQNLKAHSRHRSLTFWEGKHREWEMNRE